MKPTDLRIGNIVRIKDTGEIARICGLTKHKIGFHAPNELSATAKEYSETSIDLDKEL